jgi:hypothetical protein
VTLLIVWSLYAIAVLLVVRAPLWPRHFLPIVPGAMSRWAASDRAAHTGDGRRHRPRLLRIQRRHCALPDLAH